MISAIVLAKNEEKNIPDCIQSLSFCNEVIVIDDHSTDSTTTLAKKMKAKVITRSLTNDFSAQRNFAMSEAKNDWILFIDADERVSKSLQDEIVHVTKKHSDVNGYYIKREDHMWGKFLKHGETGNLYLLRLAKKGKGQWYGKVHEHWIATGKTESLKNPLFHFPHITVSEFLTEINFYSTIRAKELFDQHVRSNWFFILAYPTGKFFQNYILKRGFLDETPGLIFALLMSFYSFLVRGKLWLLWEE